MTRVHLLATPIVLMLAAYQRPASAQQWSASQVSASVGDTMRAAGRLPALARKVLVVRLAMAHAGPGATALPVGTVHLVVTDSGVRVSQAQRPLIGIGVVDNSARCTFLPLPLPRAAGTNDLRLTDGDDAGFIYRPRSRAFTLTRNPSQLCLAFAWPSDPGSRMELRLGANRIHVPRWYANEVTTAVDESLLPGSQGPLMQRRGLVIRLTIGHDGPDSTALPFNEVRLVLNDTLIDARDRERPLIGIGATDETGACRFLPRVLPAGAGGSDITVADSAGAGFTYRQSLLGHFSGFTLNRNPTALCLAFFLLPRMGTQATLWLGASTVPVNIQQLGVGPRSEPPN